MNSNIEYRLLREGDLPGAERLREAAGWNQTPADWRRFLALAPEGCFVVEQNNRIVGTATTTSYGRELAWIGMVLVDPESRKQGIGRQLLLTCLDHLRGQGIRCIKLDATPAGQVVYEKLGFEVEWSLARWMRPATQTRCTAKASPLRKSDWSEIERLDREAFGADRSALLRRLASDSAHSLIYRDEGGTMSGYGFLRGGINADYLGPIVIETGDSEGSVIAHTLIAETSRQLFWDIPDHCREAVALAKEHGFTIQRPFTRMYLGSNTTPGEPEKIWAISDPATG